MQKLKGKERRKKIGKKNSKRRERIIDIAKGSKMKGKRNIIKGEKLIFVQIMCLILVDNFGSA